jgi:MoaA/NifB/PqqE/SkfB family radical SAM enzyme
MSEKKKIIHIMVTSLCKRNCEYCCNKQYDLNDIPYVTDEELRNAHTLLLTGGELFAFANPPEIAQYYKSRYPNIKAVYVYSNALNSENT